MKIYIVLIFLLFLVSFVFSSSVSRSFSSPINAGSDLIVTLSVVVSETTGTAYGIEETFPQEFSLIDAGTGSVYQKTLRWIDFNSLAGTYTYSYKIKAPLTAGTYTISGVSQFEEQSQTTITGNTSINVIANCTDTDWIPIDSACQPTGTLTRTWTKIGNCVGEKTPNPETITCTYDAPTCTSFTYNDWTPEICPQTGTQTTTIKTTTPEICQGGNPQLTRTCSYIPNCTTDNWNSTDAPCQSNGTTTRTWTQVGNCTQGIQPTSPETVTCTYEAPDCIYNYSDWSECVNGTQTNSYTTTNAPCNGTPVTSRECTITPICTDNHWTYSLSECNNGTQTKTWTKTSECIEGITHTNETIPCLPIQPPTCTETDWNYRIEPSTCPKNQTQTKYWNKKIDCQSGVTKPAEETITCNYQSSGGGSSGSSTNNNTNNNTTNNQDANNQSTNNPATTNNNTVTPQNCSGTICNNICYDQEGICCNNNWNPDLNSCEYNYDAEIEFINSSKNTDASTLIEKAIGFAENGEIVKANAYKTLAIAKAKITILGNKTEQTEKYEQALLAAENGDYEQAELLITELNLPEIQTENNLLEQYLIPALVILVILATIILVFFRKKEPSEVLQQPSQDYD